MNIDLHTLTLEKAVEIIVFLQHKIEKQQQLIEKLQMQLNTNSKNSSKPPSSDQKPNSSPSCNKGGAIKGHQASHRKLIDPVDKIVKCTLKTCPTCGSQLQQSVGYSIHQVVEWELTSGRCITNYLRYRYYCPICRKRMSGPLPNNIGTSNFGPGFRSIILNLTGTYHVSRRTAQNIMNDIFGIPISLGAIFKHEKKASKALTNSYTKIRKAILQCSDVKYIDETGWRHKAANNYLWLISTKQSSYYSIQRYRSKEVLRQFLTTELKSPVVSDRCSVYDFYLHQYCLCHVLRNIKKFEKLTNLDGICARAMLKELKAVFKHWRSYKDEKSDRNKFQAHCYYRKRQLETLLLEGQLHGNRNDFRRLCQNLYKNFDKLWTFLRVKDLDITNNQAERDLRGAVIYRKLCQGTKSEDGKNFVSIMLTLSSTAKKRFLCLFRYIKECLSCIDARQEVPSLI